jgi:hypothetical protein
LLLGQRKPHPNCSVGANHSRLQQIRRIVDILTNSVGVIDRVSGEGFHESGSIHEVMIFSLMIAYAEWCLLVYHYWVMAQPHF